MSERDKRRYYQHRFVWFDAANRLQRVSRRFFFVKKGVEFAAGLAWHPDGKRLLISYGVADAESWIATVECERRTPVCWRTRVVRQLGEEADRSNQVLADRLAKRLARPVLTAKLPATPSEHGPL